MAACAVSLMMAGRLIAQLPDAPQAAPRQSSDPPRQNQPIFSLFPDLSSPSADEKLPPQTVKGKFMKPTRDLLSGWAVVKPAFAAGYKEMQNTTPEFGHGPAGFSRYYWHTVVDETSEEYMVGFVFPELTHEDTRYYRMERGGFRRRTGYSLSRVLETRDDAGREVFNSSEIGGAGAAAGLAELYYPQRERTLGHAMERWGLNVGFDALGFAGREFWPEVDRKVFHGKQ